MDYAVLCCLNCQVSRFLPGFKHRVGTSETKNNSSETLCNRISCKLPALADKLLEIPQLGPLEGFFFQILKVQVFSTRKMTIKCQK